MKPLAGRTVLVTRPADQSVDLVRRLRRLGGTAIVAPAIEIAPIRSAALTRAMRDLAAGRVRVDHAHQPRDGGDAGVAAGRPEDVRAHVAAIGDGTSAAFRAWTRRTPDLVPATFTTAGLARAFPRGEGTRALRSRRHRAARAGGRARREGVVAGPCRRLPDADGAVAPS